MKSALKIIVSIFFVTNFCVCKTAKPESMLENKSKSPIFVFGYGSLINPKSVNKTLSREIVISDLIPCSLDGYIRTWDVKDDILSVQLNKQVHGVFLNLQKAHGKNVTGVIFEVTEQEFEKMKIREKNYDYVDISGHIHLLEKAGQKKSPADVVYTFIAKPAFIASAADTNTFIMKNYINIIEEGLLNYDEEFQEKFRLSMGIMSFPILEGAYTFLDPEQRKALEKNKK